MRRRVYGIGMLPGRSADAHPPSCVLLAGGRRAGRCPGPAQLAARRVAVGFDLPVFVAAPPGDARLFVVEQSGRIQIADRASGMPLPTPFLDLSATVAYFGGDDERGLLGLAFDPSYASNGFFYVYYVVDPTSLSDPPGGVIKLARYTRSADPDQADAASARVLLSIPKPADRPEPGAGGEYYHNGGTIAFGKDGLLYVGVGDGAGWFGNDLNNCAQNASTPLGKMLRLDVARVPQGGIAVPAAPQGSCPGPVPVANAADPEIEIWAKGFRNPYRFSFDRDTGDLYVGDVGEDDREEIDVVGAAGLASAGPRSATARSSAGTSTAARIPPSPAATSSPTTARASYTQWC